MTLHIGEPLEIVVKALKILQEAYDQTGLYIEVDSYDMSFTDGRRTYNQIHFDEEKKRYFIIYFDTKKIDYQQLYV